MTATTKPPGHADGPKKAARFSSMEILGFSDSTRVWSDSPLPAPPQLALPRRGRHETTDEPDPLAGWEPSAVGREFEGGNVRWARVLILVLLATAVGISGYVLYQRQGVSVERAVGQLRQEGSELLRLMEPMSALNSEIVAVETPANTDVLPEVEASARSLFNASSTVEGPQRALAAEAASKSLDAAQVLSDAIAYRRAVTPILVAPILETDPTLIQLDEAARDFGDWQIGFDAVRTALPGGMFAEVTEALDTLSGDLSNVLSGYIDALREDDESGARARLEALGGQMSGIAELLDDTLSDIQSRIAARIAETGATLESLLS